MDSIPSIDDVQRQQQQVRNKNFSLVSFTKSKLSLTLKFRLLKQMKEEQ
jgi:hypothetical protein